MNINQQMETFEVIKQLCSNYKKDGASRKTIDYLTKRLVALENLWQDFHERHQSFQLEEIKDLQYFKDKIYEKTKELYNSTRTDILQRLMVIQEKQPKVAIEHGPETEGKTNELLDRQECNLRALERAMMKIDLDTITEKWEMEDHLNILRNKWDAVEKTHWELESILKGSNEPYNTLFNAKEINYDHMRKQLNAKIHSSSYYQSSTPRIDLPEFYGNYTQWVSFRDLFMETIHKNPAVSRAQKMQHLKAKLKGEPEKLLQHLVISSENYDTCWEILNQRYDNRRLLFTNLMNTMLQLPTIQQPNASALKKMHDVINECLNGLHNIGLSTTSWDPIVVYLMSQKLDSTTYSEYTRDLRQPREVPNLDEFLTFLENKFMSLEAARGHQKETQQTKTPYGNKSYPNNFNKRQLEHSKGDVFSKIYHTSFGKCPLCDGNHVSMQCTKFIDMDTYKRNNTITKLKLCKNCLYSHGNAECTSNKTCKDCNKPHHTLLHYATKQFTAPKFNVNNAGQRYNHINTQPSTSSGNNQTSNHLSNHDKEVLLTTAEILVKTLSGSFITLRALLDQGSQVSLITENAAQRLRLPRKRVNATISGVGSISGDCKGLLELECKSHCTNFTFQTDVMIIKQITNNLPNTTFEKINWSHMEGLKLADPEYNTSRKIDLLLGADVYSQVLLEGVLKGNGRTPVAQQTHLGWILCGKLRTFNCHVTLVDMQELTKFWETEDIIQQQEDMSKNDWCETHYQQTTQRDANGKYIVKMPLLPDYKDKLGHSKSIAVSQFLQLERKFERQPKLASMYKDFIKEYIDMGHMKPCSYTPSKHQNYVPHHGILREQSTTTKLRTVFNGSQKTIGGCSINDVMEKGPNLQKDIQSLILQWRTYKYVYTADIEKMYRCIQLHQEQQPLLKIIWRTGPTEKLQEYQLCTVTYGTKSAPWLAMRTLQQLAADEGHRYPEAADVLRNQFYVDDAIAGHSSLDSAKQVQQSLINLLKEGGMNLRKWCSNHPELLRNLTQDQISQTDIFNFKSEETMKTLGLRWSPKDDVFTFNWNLEAGTEKLTKRHLLSQISKLYDPLGWLSPITILAKLLFQTVWISNIGWDTELQNETKQKWMQLNNELQLIKHIKISRWLGSSHTRLQLHGFCDASEKAYACVIYSRVTDESDVSRVTLLAARTKVIPLSQKTSLPRLELCGALLLTQLINKVQKSLPGHDVTAFAWCDSKVVLAWLQGDTNKWERYVANRVEKITTVIRPKQWLYIKSELNPADCATRGLLPSKLNNFSLWWDGPTLLQNFKQQEAEHTSRCLFTTNEARIHNPPKTKTQQSNENKHFIEELLHNKSALTHIHRIVAWVIRYTTCLRNKTRHSNMHLTTDELQTSAEYVLKYVQQKEFAQECKLLKQNKLVTSKSNIYKLNPYIDNKGIIRIGGRLQHSILPINMKNPAVIPSCSRYTKLLIDHAHLATLHGGARLTLSYIRQRYWVIAGNRTVKAHLRRCVTCHRFNTTRPSQLMGDLPAPRITPSRPFTHSGVDFTGSVDVKLNKGRGVKTTKAYIAIFVCMVTKAVHLELVSELSTEAFIAAFQRMCAKRGTPEHMYSDNGTNFVGASRVLKTEFEAFKQLLSPAFFTEIDKLEVRWHFNAPSWPSAGGLFEAAVKSMKHHLRRVLGEQKLTWEEFTTLLAKIEACMNSRPLCPLTEDPEEFYNSLTPGHFLTGSPTLQLPQPHSDDRHLDLRKRWQLTEHMLEQFWKAWSNDYLTTLQTRCKWQRPTTNLKPEDIVLIKESNLPPGKWAMGRVIEVYPGPDGLVRVATVKTKTGILKRPMIKLSPLPIEEKPEKERNKSPKPASTKQSLFTFISLLTLMFTMITGSNCSVPTTTQITKLESGRPVYYNELGNINLMHDEWILVMYYNLTTHWQANQKIKNYLSNIEEVCNKLDPRYCQTTLDQLKHEMNQLAHYNDLLLTPHKQLSLRRKRGLINGVGYIANTLFGVLDQRFAEKYQEDIENIQNNEKYLQDLTRNQTSIIEIENESLKRSELNLQKQFVTLNTYIEQTNMSFAIIENELQALMAANYFSSSSITAYLLLNNIKAVQDIIFNSMIQIYQGHIDIHLLTPSNLKKELNNIAGRLPKTLSLPIDQTQDLKQIYQLLNVKARTTESYVLYEIHIPLLSEDDFTLYKIIPLPVTYNNTTRWLQMASTHIAINLRKNTYISLTTEDIKQCVPQDINRFLCNAALPVFNLLDNNALCEAQMISQRPISTCRTLSLPCKDAWIKLHAKNSWLITCCSGECPIRIICNDDVTVQIITSSNLINLGQGCIAQSKELTIYSHNVYKSNLKAEPDIQIPKLDTSVNKFVNLTLQKPEVFLANNTELSEIDRRIKTMIDSEKRSLKSITHHDLHQYIICYVLVAIAFTAVIIWLVKKRYQLCCKKHESTEGYVKDPHYEDIELREQKKSYATVEATAAPAAAAAAAASSSHLRSMKNCHTASRHNPIFSFE